MVRPSNPASRRVLERGGFVATGLVALHGAPTMRLQIGSAEYNRLVA